MSDASTRTRWRSHLICGAVGGLLVGWLLAGLLGPPVAAYGPLLRDNPRLSDGVVGAGGMLTYISEAPAIYLGAHLRHDFPAPGVTNALGWTLIGLTIGAFIAAIRDVRHGSSRQRVLVVGGLGGLLLGWMIPALCMALGGCFVHCWMHEGLLGRIALAGGSLLRVVGTLAELPWRLVAGPAQAVRSVAAIPFSAIAWTAFGVLVAAMIRAARSRESEARDRSEEHG